MPPDACAAMPRVRPRFGPGGRLARWLAWLAGSLCLLMPQAGAALGVLKLSHTELWLRGDGRAGALYAENTGDSTLFVDVEQRLLLNPGQSPERLVPVADVEHPTLLVAPQRLALAPGQRYPIRVQELGRLDAPKVWRVTFRPREKLLADRELADGIAAPLAVSIGYGVLIYQLPVP